VTFGRSMGMLHAGSAPVAVLMLGAIGYEELCLRATWRSLAQAISDKGIACLRFDYPGQGDAHEAADVQGAGRLVRDHS
jgi:predicted alpha/beta hydrolase